MQAIAMQGGGVKCAVRVSADSPTAPMLLLLLWVVSIANITVQADIPKQ